MQPAWLLGRQYQLQPFIAARGSGERKLPSRASNLPRVEDLVVARWSSVILVDDQMRVRNLLPGDRFRLGPLAVRGADSRERFTRARTDRPESRTIARQTRQRLLGEAEDNRERLCKRSQWARRFTRANNREPSTKVKRLIRARSDRDKASDSSESGRIATDLTKERLTKHKNKYKYCQKSEVWDLDQGLEVWNRSGARSRSRRPWDLGSSGGWCRKINSKAILDSIC